MFGPGTKSLLTEALKKRQPSTSEESEEVGGVFHLPIISLIHLFIYIYLSTISLSSISPSLFLPNSLFVSLALLFFPPMLFITERPSSRRGENPY